MNGMLKKRALEAKFDGKYRVRVSLHYFRCYVYIYRSAMYSRMLINQIKTKYDASPKIFCFLLNYIIYSIITQEEEL